MRRSTTAIIRRSALAAGTAALVLGLLLAAYHTRLLLLLLFAGVLGGIFLRSMSGPLARRLRVSNVVSLAIVLLGIAALIAGAVLVTGPALTRQVDELQQQLPRAIDQVEQSVRSHSWGRRLLGGVPSVDQVVEQQGGVIEGARTLFSRATSIIAAILIITFTAIFLAADPAVYRRGLLRLVAPAARRRAEVVVGDAVHQLRWWLISRAISMAIVGVLVFVGLLILDVPLAFVLGLLAGLLDFIPYFGPLLAALPAVLLALVEGPRQAIYVAALYLVVQTIESYLISPVVERKTVRLLPAITLGFQVLLGAFTGLLGAALASPLLAAIVVLVQRLYVQDLLGDRTRAEGREV